MTKVTWGRKGLHSAHCERQGTAMRAALTGGGGGGHICGQKAEKTNAGPQSAFVSAWSGTSTRGTGAPTLRSVFLPRLNIKCLYRLPSTVSPRWLKFHLIDYEDSLL